MEVSGKTGAEVMQRWIREEFASILHKRDQGLPDEAQRIRHELQIPEFSGGNVEDWIYQLEDFFHFFQLQEEEKLKVAMIALDGGALQWFEWENERQSFYGWLDLKVQLLRVFGFAPACFWQPSTPMLTGKVESQNLSLVHEYGGLSGFVEGCTKQGKSGGPCSASVVVPEENQGSSHHQKVASEKIEVAKRVDLENKGCDGLQKSLSTDESSFTWRWRPSFEKGNRILRGSSDGNKVDLTWTFNASGGGRFVKGGSEASGSGGGPGLFAGVQGGFASEFGGRPGGLQGGGTSSEFDCSVDGSIGGFFESGGADCSGSGGGPGSCDEVKVAGGAESWCCRGDTEKSFLEEYDKLSEISIDIEKNPEDDTKGKFVIDPKVANNTVTRLLGLGARDFSYLHQGKDLATNIIKGKGGLVHPIKFEEMMIAWPTLSFQAFRPYFAKHKQHFQPNYLTQKPTHSFIQLPYLPNSHSCIFKSNTKNATQLIPHQTHPQTNLPNAYNQQTHNLYPTTTQFNQITVLGYKLLHFDPAHPDRYQAADYHPP